MRNTALAVLALFALATVITVAQRAELRSTDSPDVALKTAINRELVDGDLDAAVQRYREIVTRYHATAPTVAARALVQMAASYDKLGSPDASKVYEEVLRDFPTERDAVVIARARLGGPPQSPGIPPATLTTQRVLDRGGADDRISPDGRYVARPDHSTGNLVLYEQGMWRVPIDGGTPHKIAVDVGRIFSWRFDAKTGQVAFSTNGRGPSYEMWKMENFLPTPTARR